MPNPRRYFRSHLTSLACAGLVVLFAYARVSAHDFWIEPSTFSATAGAPLSFALRVGVDFKGDPVPRSAAMIERFVIAGPDGVRDVMGREGFDPAGYVPIATPGVYVIGYRSRPTSLEQDAAKFERYLREEGLERISDQRKQAGRSNLPGLEIFSRCAKAIVSSSAEPLKDQALGLRLELIAEKITPGKPSTFRLMYEGQPLEGALVVAIPKDAPMEKLTARTDKAGRVNLTLGGSVWLLKAVHMVAAPRETGAEWESLWASTTFDVPVTPTRGDRKSDAAARRSDRATPAGRASR